MASFALLSIIASVLVQTYGFGVIPRLDGRIVNGENAVIGDFPYQLSLQSYSSHFCGASILSRTVVLTAAHCTAAVSTNLNVRAGSSFTNSGGGTAKVSRVNQHPYYDASTFDYDVCVLQLSNSLVYGSPITLQPVGQEVADGSLAVVTGWGALYEGGPSPNQLQKVSVARVNANKCNSDYGGIITDHMICFASPGKDSCQGDSGGPLAYGGRQVGIVSWGYGCARPEYPGVYTKVSNQEINSYITRYL